MTQPTFTDGPPVPLMVEGILTADSLSQLFSDLASEATLLKVQEKGEPTDYTTGELSVEVACDRLLTGAARAVQVRYLFDGHEWTDTLISVGGAYRVIRCQHE